MSGVRHWYQRRSEAKYVPPRPRWTDEQRLDECLRIADRIERGISSPIDEIALTAHLRVLRGFPMQSWEVEAMEEARDIA